MECDGYKEIIYFNQDNRDAQILMNLSRSFPDKYISFGGWTDANDKAILTVEDSSIYTEVFLLDLTQQNCYLLVPLQISQKTSCIKTKGVNFLQGMVKPSMAT